MLAAGITLKSFICNFYRTINVRFKQLKKKMGTSCSIHGVTWTHSHAHPHGRAQARVHTQTHTHTYAAMQVTDLHVHTQTTTQYTSTNIHQDLQTSYKTFLTQTSNENLTFWQRWLLLPQRLMTIKLSE